MTSSDPHRGEIWRVQFNPTIGDEMQKARPAIVISVDDLTRLKLRLVIPITSWKAAFASIPWLIRLNPSAQNGLTKVSTANPLQTRSVALERFNEPLGALEAERLEAVILALGVVVRYPLG